MGFPLIEQSRHQLQFWGINSAIWTHGCGDCPVIGWKQNDSIAAEGTPEFSTSVSSWLPLPELCCGLLWIVSVVNSGGTLVDLIVRKMMKKLSGWILGVLFAGSVIAEPTQTLTTNINGYVGGEVNVSVEHSAIDASTGLTGIGFRIHYDSAALSNASLENVFENGFLSKGDMADDKDLDGDPATDRFFIIAWVNVTGGDWPGVDPQALVSVVGDLNYSTTLNFTETAVTSGYNFEAASIFLD